MPHWFSRPFAVNFTHWRILTDIIGDDFSGLFMDQVHLAQAIKQAVASSFPIYLRCVGNISRIIRIGRAAVP